MSAAAGKNPVPLSKVEECEMKSLEDHIRELSENLPIDQPWASELSQQWDSISVDQFFRKRCQSKLVLREWLLAAKTILAEEPERISFLYFLFFLKANGGIGSVSDGLGGAQTYKLAEGMETLAIRMASCLPAGSVRLGSAVTKITRWQQSEGEQASDLFCELIVNKDPSTVWRARAVVITAPPTTILAKITFDPPLPSEKQAALKLPSGAAAKVLTLYRNPFWLNQKDFSQLFVERKSGQPNDSKGHQQLYQLGVFQQKQQRKMASVSMQQIPDKMKMKMKIFPPESSHFSELGPVTNIFHTKIGDLFGLVGLIVGETARTWQRLSFEERRRAIVEQYAKIYHTQEALEPIEYFDYEWMSDPFASGCFAGVAPPNFLTSNAGVALRKATGALFWAGTETSIFWTGYFEGALASGERAAGEVFSFLRSFRFRAKM